MLEFSPAGLAFAFWPSHLKIPRLPIVVLHGLLGSHKNFASFARTFSALGHPVLCVDSRNHGASFHAEAFDYPSMAEDLESLLSWLDEQSYGALDWQKIVLMGHSMGGRTALVYALLYPARIAGLIPIDVVPSLQNPDSSIGEIVAAMRQARPLLEFVRCREDAEAILRHELQERGNNSVLQYLLLCNLQRVETGGYRWACGLDSIARNLQQIVCWPARWLEEHGHSSENLPLTLIAGGRSPYVQYQGWELLIQYFPHTEACPTIKRVIEGAHHWPHTETPQEFRGLVAEFLDRIQP